MHYSSSTQPVLVEKRSRLIRRDVALPPALAMNAVRAWLTFERDMHTCAKQ